MHFEWDPEKAKRNATLHGVTFDEAKEVFETDLPVLEVFDVEHSDEEDRFKTIGPIERGIVLVVWAERADDLVRIISAWWATKAEQQMYKEYVEGNDG